MSYLTDVFHLGTLGVDELTYSQLKERLRPGESLVAVFERLTNGQQVTEVRSGVPELMFDALAANTYGRYSNVCFFADPSPSGRSSADYRLVPVGA